MIDKLLGREPVHELPRVDYEAEYASIRAELDGEPPYVVKPLPVYDHDRVCPKCHYVTGTTLHRKGYHDECTIPEASDISWPYTSFFGYNRSEHVLKERWRRTTAAIPEHFERKCPNCSYMWAEAVR